MKIKITEFGGMAPGTAGHLLPANGAQDTENVNYDKGDLRAWKMPFLTASIISTYDATAQYLATDAKQVIYSGRLYYCTSDTPNPAGAWDDTKWTLIPIQSLFRFEENSNSHWIVSDKTRDYVRSLNPSDIYERVYLSGENELWVYCNDLVSSPFDPWGDYYKLGVPAPTSACVVDTYTGSGSDYRAWYYTYVNKYGEEGPPSDIVEVADYLSGNVTLDTFTEPPTGRALENGVIRLYRTNSSTAGIAEFQQVKDTNINGFTFATDSITDDVASVDLGEVCPSETWSPPPDGLEGLTLFSSNIMVAFKDNVLYMSAPGFPHAWPTENQYPIASLIKGIKVYGAIIYAVTDDLYYFFYGDDPGNMSKDNSETMYPCSSKASMATCNAGVLFAGNEGLMLLNASGCINITQGSVYGVQDWIDMNPTTMNGTFYNGKYFFFYTDIDGKRNGALLDIESGNKLTKLSLFAYAGYPSYGDGELYMVLTENNRYAANASMYIKQWNADPYNYLRRLWKSRKYLLPNEMIFPVGRVFIDRKYHQTILDTAEDEDYIKDLNAPIFAAGNVSGEINSDGITVFEINGDNLYSPSSIQTNANADLEVYIDGELVHSEPIMNNNIFKILKSAKGSELEMIASGYIPMYTIELAGSAQEMITS